MLKNHNGENENLIFFRRNTDALLKIDLSRNFLFLFTPNCIFSYPECVLEYTGNLASQNIVGEIWEDVCKVSFGDFKSSVDFPHRR